MDLQTNLIITVCVVIFELFFARLQVLSAGLELARLADLPKDVRDEAARIANKLSARQADRREQGLTNKVVLRRKALVRVSTCCTLVILVFESIKQLHARLRQAADHSTLPEEDLARYLATLQQEILSVLGDTLQPTEIQGE
jgi:DNA mismatch repair protein MSH4